MISEHLRRSGALALAAALTVAGCAAEQGPRRAIGETCARDTECSTGRCDELVCKASEPVSPGGECEHDLDCATERCVSVDGAKICAERGTRPLGESCTADLQCASARCVAEHCAAAEVDAGSRDAASSDAGPLEASADDLPADAGAAEASTDDLPADRGVVDTAQDASMMPDFGSSLAHSSSRSFGSTFFDFAEGVAIAPNGDLVVGGVIQGAADLGGGEVTPVGSMDVFIARYDSAGNHLWSKGVGGGTFSESGGHLAVDGGGHIVLAGQFNGTVDFGGGSLSSTRGDVFVARFDADGNNIWAKSFGGPEDDLALDVAADATGAIVLTGQFRGTALVGAELLASAGNQDAFIAAYDSSGQALWSHRLGGSSADAGSGVAISDSGLIAMTGSFTTVAEIGGTPIIGAGNTDAFLSRFDRAGNHLGSQALGGSGIDHGYGLAIDGAGEIVVTGSFAGSADFGGGALASAGSADVFVARFDSGGNHLSSARFGGSGADYGHSVAVDPWGRVAFTGSFEGVADFAGNSLSSAGDDDVFVALLARSGALVWAERFGGALSDVGEAITIDGLGRVGVVGTFKNTPDFGGGALPNAGETDIFVLTLAP